MKKIIQYLCINVLLISLLCTPIFAQQTYVYNFNNSFAEESGSGPNLNPLGSISNTSESLPDLSCLSRNVSSFTVNSGYSFDNGAAGNFIGGTYSVELYFKYTSSNSFMRIIDFKNRTSDSGLYATPTSLLFYDGLTFPTSVFASSVYNHLVITRNGGSGEVNLYLNGSNAGSFTDVNNDAVLNGANVLNFFRDDLVFGNEAASGRIALLRIHDFELNSGEVSTSFQNLESASGTVAFSPDVTSSCLTGNLFNFTNESQNTGSVTYSWEFGDGDTDTGTNSSHSYAAVGNYTVLLIADNGGGCTDTASVIVTVTGTPTITPSGPVDLCLGASVTLSASAGASYLWSNGETTQDIVTNIAGDYWVTVDDGAGCIANSDTVTVTQFAAIPGGLNNFVGLPFACPGVSQNYGVNPVNRVVYYTWTLPTGATVNGQNPYITFDNVVTVDFGGGFTGGQVSVTAHNGCGVRGPVSKNVNLSAPITPASIAGPTTACAGQTYTYSTPFISGVTSYNWTAPVGAIITGQGNDTVDITFPGGFVSGYVRVANENACGVSNNRSLYVRSTPPKPGTISGPVSALCGSTQTYTVQPSIGATTYNWIPPTGSSVVSGQGTTTAEIAFSNGLNTGYVRVTASNACGTSGIRRLPIVGGVVISDDPVDAGVCSGDNATFSVAAPGTGLIYQWRKDGINLVNGGNISGADAATITIDPVSLSDAGVYDCIVGRFCGSSDLSDGATLSVDDGPAAPGPITGPDVACVGDAGFGYSFTPVPGAISYDWTGDIGVTIASGQGTNNVTIDFGPTPLSGYYLWVIASSSCGISDTGKYWVRNKVSVPTFNNAPTTVCAGSNSVAFVIDPVNGATSYTWTVPAGATIVNGQGTTSLSVDFSPGFTSGDVCVSASNICFTSAERCVTVMSTPNTPGNIQGVTTNVCNSTQSYTVNNAVGAISYQWTAPAGASIASGQGTNTVTVDFGPTFTIGDLEVVSQNICGNSGIRSRTMYAAPPKPAAVFGDPAPCAFSTGNVYNIDPLPGATSYEWTVPIGATITNGATTNTITVDFGGTNGNITARGINACGPGFKKGLGINFGCRIIGGVSNDLQTSVYPNPVANELNLVIENFDKGNAQVMITDISGRVISKQEVIVSGSFEKYTINVESLKSGIYFMNVNMNGVKAVSRFVKE